MSISTNKSDDGKVLIIKVEGKFDFSLHNEFRNAYKDEDAPGEFHIDLGGTDYLDSSALGMLLLFKEHAETVSSAVKIINVNADIKEILVIACFDKLFQIT